MKNKKRFLILIVSALGIIFSSFSQQMVTPITESDGVVTVKEIQKAKSLKMLRVNSVAQKAKQQGEKAGEFKNVSYTLAPNVKILTKGEKSQLNVIEDGILKINKTIGRFIPSQDSIYLDDESDLVLQASEASDEEMFLIRPKMYQVFENIEIPEQTVDLTLANTTSTADGVQITSSGSGANYAVNLQFDSVTFTIDTVKITLIGEVTLEQPRVEGYYSKNSGYKLVFKTSERVDLRARAFVKLSEEKKIPIWGTEIPVANIGKCELGVFAVVSVEGEVTLVVDVNQGVDVALGARGGTFYYIPTSIHNASEFSQFCEVDYEVKAKMKAFAGVECKAKLKFKSYNVLDVFVKGGMEGTVETDLTTLSADIGVRFKAGGKIVSKGFTLVDEYFSLWKLQTPDMAGYKMNIDEACAFGDYVAGNIQKTDNGNDFYPYKGNLQVVVVHSNGSTNKYNGQSDDNGIFIVKNVPLVKSDKVAIKLVQVNNLSAYMSPTIPFKKVYLTAVDYYTGMAYGSVSASKSDWYKLATQTQSSSTSANSAMLAQIGTQAFANTSVAKIKSAVEMSHSEMMERITKFKNNTLAYSGEIKFYTRSKPTTTLSKNQSSTSKSGTKTINKPKQNRGYVNNSMGFFAINDLDFSPNQEIKAHVELEGFTIESDWMETDGLLVSEIESVGVKTAKTQKTETISADNSFVIVSALRSENYPTGNVAMLEGVGMPHASVTNAQTVPEFPNVKNAIVLIDKTSTLKPVPEDPGTSIAETKNWSSIINYVNMSEAINPSKNGKHPFEKVSYVYKNNDLGFKYFIDECHSCKSPQNIIDRTKQLQDVQLNNQLQNASNKLNKQIPKTIINKKMGGTKVQNM